MDKNEVMHRPRHPAVRINHFTSYFSLKIGKNLIIWFPHGIRASGGGRWKDGRQVTSGYSSSDWWLLTDPCDCDWQALTTTPLALASAHCWAQQVVWRLAEIPNKMDITGKTTAGPAEVNVGHVALLHHTACQGSLTLHRFRIVEYTATLRQTSYWASCGFLTYALWSIKGSTKQEREREKASQSECVALRVFKLSI